MSELPEDEITDIGKLPQMFIVFKSQVFAEFFLYHMIFFMVLGPLTVLVLSVYPGYALARNLQF